MQTRTRSRKRNFPLFRTMALLVPILIAVVLMSQTVFAQYTYVITDGTRVLVHTTSATDLNAVLNEAGLKLNADDTFTTQRGDGISEITVQRGRSAEYGTQVEQEQVARVETYTTSIPHSVTYYHDPNLPAGVQEVLTKGVNGELLCTANVVYSGGKETSRTVLTQTVVKNPVEEVIAIGTGSAGQSVQGVDSLTIKDGFIYTANGEVLSYTGTLRVLATAYTCEGDPTPPPTATGTKAREGAIAVDPRVIPYGTRMFIVTEDGQYIYGIATAEDCGGLILGNRVDLYYDTEEECIDFGARWCTIYILG